MFEEQAVLGLVHEFCRSRRVEAGGLIRVVANLDAAFDVIVLKGPDSRWRKIVSRPCGDDFRDRTPTTLSHRPNGRPMTMPSGNMTVATSHV